MTIVDVATARNRSLCEDPTESEMARFVSHPAIESWGEHVREQKSIRVLCLGGSNTYLQHGKHKYPEVLNAFIERAAPGGSYALNEGKPGLDICIHTDTYCIPFCTVSMCRNIAPTCGLMACHGG